MSGADLANLANEAALHAVRRNSKTISMEDFESARDRVLMGQLRDTMVMMDDERERVAFHESGHALLAYVLEKTDPLHKITHHPARHGPGRHHDLARRRPSHHVAPPPGGLTVHAQWAGASPNCSSTAISRRERPTTCSATRTSRRAWSVNGHVQGDWTDGVGI